MPQDSTLPQFPSYFVANPSWSTCHSLNAYISQLLTFRWCLFLQIIFSSLQYHHSVTSAEPQNVGVIDSFHKYLQSTAKSCAATGVTHSLPLPKLGSSLLPPKSLSRLRITSQILTQFTKSGGILEAKPPLPPCLSGSATPGLGSSQFKYKTALGPWHPCLPNNCLFQVSAQMPRPPETTAPRPILLHILILTVPSWYLEPHILVIYVMFIASLPDKNIGSTHVRERFPYLLFLTLSPALQPLPGRSKHLVIQRIDE